jgi:hypothetical protein
MNRSVAWRKHRTGGSFNRHSGAVINQRLPQLLHSSPAAYTITVSLRLELSAVIERL